MVDTRFDFDLEKADQVRTLQPPPAVWARFEYILEDGRCKACGQSVPSSYRGSYMSEKSATVPHKSQKHAPEAEEAPSNLPPKRGWRLSRWLIREAKPSVIVRGTS